MRVVVAAIVIVALGLVRTSPARATDRDAFAKRVGKYATIDASKPKGLCWCKDGFGPLPGSGDAGYVVQQNYGGSVVVSCMIPQFDTDGSFTDYIGCYVEWDMLGK
jgi:hypothetical protein